MEGVDGYSDLGHGSDNMPRPQLVVFDVVGCYAVLSTEVHQENRCPYDLQDAISLHGIVVLLALPAKEGSKGVYGQSVAA
jgi:hypothetical protein